MPGVQWQAQGVVHIGLVPAPQALAGYGQINPSFPDRIVKMAEENARTARKTAERAQTFALAERLVARPLGLAFALGAVSLSAYLALHGHDGVAGVIGGTTVVAVTVALIAGKSP